MIDGNAAAIEQVSRSAQGLTQSAQEVSSLAGSSAAAAHQLEAVTRKIASVVEESKTTSSRVGVSARTGGASVGRTIGGLVKIRQAMVEGATVMKDMSHRAEEIGDIVQTINLIADRTNLLSLNASIEAARAGEHGRGFAVIAVEIRALAERAAAAASDVTKIVRGLQGAARDAQASSTEGMRMAEEGAQLSEEARRDSKRSSRASSASTARSRTSARRARSRPARSRASRRPRRGSRPRASRSRESTPSRAPRSRASRARPARCARWRSRPPRRRANRRARCATSSSRTASSRHSPTS